MELYVYIECHVSDQGGGGGMGIGWHKKNKNHINLSLQPGTKCRTTDQWLGTTDVDVSLTNATVH